jgi:hypothetical protein
MVGGDFMSITERAAEVSVQPTGGVIKREPRAEITAFALDADAEASGGWKLKEDCRHSLAFHERTGYVGLPSCYQQQPFCERRPLSGGLVF